LTNSQNQNNKQFYNRYIFWGNLCVCNPATFHCHWSASTKQGKWAVMYMCVKGINFSSFYNLSIGFWNCSDNVVFFSSSFYPYIRYIFILLQLVASEKKVFSFIFLQGCYIGSGEWYMKNQPPILFTKGLSSFREGVKTVFQKVPC